ncbi:phage tail tape measure protein [Staphylococcus felis]|uniref:Phage tail tape measure protein n=1 Tax=Staphylococcus felis TaxID=46127 RepID=A0ABS0QLN4_9STAP|nr:phage tail tape measure protein [Staphylococcus felis]MBH9580133.1 phage tail tape measure protein [Staphylococcus felis]REI09542.1 phage tail tape measure protein [Staphylococcus felis]
MAQKYDIAARLHADATGFIASFKAAEQAVESFNRAVSRTNVTAATSNLGAFQTANNKSEEAVAKNVRQLDRFNRTARGFALTGIAGAAAFGAAMIGSLSAFSSYESALAGVKKTVNATAKEYRDMDLAFRKMATSMPASYEEIARVAEVAGQLGVEKDSVVEFTDTMIRLGESTVLSAEDAAMGIQRVMNVMGTASGDVDRFGATLVALGNNFSTNEDEILEMTQRLSGMANQMGMSEADAMALATAMSSVGIKAEMGGSAMSRTMVKMNTALQQGGAEAQKWADIMGMSVEDASRLMKEDAYSALLKMLEGMEQAQEGGKNLDDILKDLGITELRQVDTLKRLVGATDQVSNAQKIANGAWKENTALIEESNKRFETFASKVQMMWNRVRNIFANMGAAIAGSKSEIAGALDGILQKIEQVTDKFIDSEGDVTRFGQKFAEAAKAIVAASAVVGLAGAAFMAFGPAGAVTVGVVAGLGAIVLAGKKVADYFNAGPLEKGMRQIEHISDDTTHKSASKYLEMKDNVSKYMSQLKMQTGAEAEQTRGKIVSEFEKMAQETVAALDKEQAQMEGMIESFMEGATGPQLDALKKAKTEVQQHYQEAKKQAMDFSKTMADVMNNHIDKTGRITTEGMRMFSQAAKGMDETFGTALANSTEELSKLQAGFDEIIASGSPQQIQDSLSKMARATIDSIKEVNKGYDEYINQIKASGLATEEQNILIDFANQKRAEETKALIENLRGHEKLAREKDSGIDATKGLMAEEERLLEILQEEGPIAKQALESLGLLTDGKSDLEKGSKNATKALDEENEKLRNSSLEYLKLGDTLGKIPEKYKQIAEGSKETAEAVGKDFVTKFKDGFEGVDITGVGRMKLDEFVKGVQDGSLKVNDVAVAQINKMRAALGKDSLTPEGRKALESFVSGIKNGSESVSAVAKQLGLSLKDGATVDLGPKGKVTTESFVKGLQDGTYGIAEFSAMLEQRLQEMAKKDLTAVGQEDMSTLSAGLNAGLLSVNEVGTMLESSLKTNSQVDLTEEGRKSIQTLLNGLKNGSVSVPEFLSEYKQILKTQSKADLTPEGTETMNTFNSGLQTGAGPIKETANQTKLGVETALSSTTDGGGGNKAGMMMNDGLAMLNPLVAETANGISTATETNLANTTDGGGGNKAGSTFNQGLGSFLAYILQTGNSIVTGTSTTLGSATDGGGGVKAGSEMNSGLLGFLGRITGTANIIKGGTQNTLGSTTDGGGGNKSGSQFNRGLSGNVGPIKSTSNNIKSGTQSILGSATDGGGGNRAGSQFVSGLGSNSGAARSAGSNVASSGKGGLGSIGGTFGLGQNFGQGFVNGIASMVGAAVRAASSLASAALGAIRRAQRSASPSKETRKLGGDFGDGYWLGVERKKKEAMKASASLASTSLEAFEKALGKNPFDLGAVADMRQNMHALRPQMNKLVTNNLSIDVPRTRMKLDVNVHADQEWIRADVNEGNAIDERLNYMGR